MTEQQQPSPSGSTAPTDTTLAVVAHATVCTGFLIPLIVWLVAREKNAFVDTEGKEALNFGIVVTIGYVAAGVLYFIPFLGGLLNAAVFLVALILGIQGAMQASRGQGYRYPFGFRLVS